jgi:hypothetical protein
MFYQVYLMSQQKLHIGLLDKKYEEIPLDINEAIAAIRTTGLGMKKHKEKAIAALDVWRRRKETATRVKRSLSMEEIIELDKFHNEILFFLEDLQDNADQLYWLCTFDLANHMPKQLTNSERRRFATALCRLVIYVNIFGENVEAKGFVPSAEDNDWEKVTSAEDAWGLFFGTMPPWEYEEMGGVETHLMYRWDEVLENVEDEQKTIIKDWYRCSTDNYPVQSVYRDSLHKVGGTPFRKLTPEGVLDGRPPGDVIWPGNMILGFHRHAYDALYFTSLGPRLLFRIMHADTLVRHKTLLANINIRTRFQLRSGFNARMPRNRRFPLLYPAEMYNVESFDELWSKTSATDQPGAFWRRVTQDLFTQHRDFKAAFVKEHVRNDPDGHCIDVGWEWQADIWDEEKLDILTDQLHDWYESYWADAFG